MKHRPLVAYFLIVFGFGWGLPALAFLVSGVFEGYDVSIPQYSLLQYFIAWSPALAALIVVGSVQGAPGLKDYAVRLVHWRADATWSLFILLGVPFLYLLAALFGRLLGEPAAAASGDPQPAFAAALLAGSTLPWGEIGWRGIALPLLQRRFVGLVAAVLMGVICGLWQLPAYFMGEYGDAASSFSPAAAAGLFLLQAVALSVVLTVLYNATGGSIPLAFLTSWLVRIPYPWGEQADGMIVQSLGLAAAAVVMVVLLGKRYLGHENLHTEITPGRYSL
ncbi:MAG TPA: hypothetical protein PLB96_09655 [Syntrophales bacterium]|nr:hypothetical protein [Syntrophales bacterium]